MTVIEAARWQAGQLREQARSVRSQAQDTRAQTRVLIKAAAATEDQIAATLDHLAGQQPGRAGHLRGMGESSRTYAMLKRNRLIHQPGRTGQDHGSGAACMPEADAAATMPGQAGVLAVIEERDRIAGRVREVIISRVFAAGLILECAAGLARNPEASRRIEAAVSELDEVIREIRNAIFEQGQQPEKPGAQPGHPGSQRAIGRHGQRPQQQPRLAAADLADDAWPGR